MSSSSSGCEHEAYHKSNLVIHQQLMHLGQKCQGVNRTYKAFQQGDDYTALLKKKQRKQTTLIILLTIITTTNIYTIFTLLTSQMCKYNK